MLTTQELIDFVERYLNSYHPQRDYSCYYSPYTATDDMRTVAHQITSDNLTNGISTHVSSRLVVVDHCLDQVIKLENLGVDISVGDYGPPQNEIERKILEEVPNRSFLPPLIACGTLETPVGSFSYNVYPRYDVCQSCDEIPDDVQNWAYELLYNETSSHYVETHSAQHWGKDSSGNFVCIDFA